MPIVPELALSQRSAQKESCPDLLQRVLGGRNSMQTLTAHVAAVCDAQANSLKVATENATIRFEPERMPIRIVSTAGHSPACRSQACPDSFTDGNVPAEQPQRY